MASDPILIVTTLAAAFDSLGVPYLVGGSVASSVHGISRATEDVDVVADLTERQVVPLVAALENDFYVDSEMVLDEVRRRGSFNILFKSTLDKADVFVLSGEPWAQEQMSRRRAERLGDDEDAPAVYFCSSEDIVLQKLRWYRMGGEVSDRQWGDVTGVLKVQADALDLDYMRHWAAELGIADLLERAKEDAGLGAHG